MIDQFLTEWLRYSTTYAASKSLAQIKLEKLIQEYQNPQRHYHNLSHLSNLLDHFHHYHQMINNPITFYCAIWYHDVVYNTLRSDNEEKSAEYAASEMKDLHIPASVIENTQQIIQATAHHTSLTGQENKDVLLFLDFDLGILGSQRGVYEKYMQSIRKEYNHIPEEVYKTGRKKILENFANTESIYKTYEFREKYEKAARENIRYEIQKLSKS